MMNIRAQNVVCFSFITTAIFVLLAFTAIKKCGKKNKKIQKMKYGESERKIQIKRFKEIYLAEDVLEGVENVASRLDEFCDPDLVMQMLERTKTKAITVPCRSC